MCVTPSVCLNKGPATSVCLHKGTNIPPAGAQWARRPQAGAQWARLWLMRMRRNEAPHISRRAKPPFLPLPRGVGIIEGSWAIPYSFFVKACGDWAVGCAAFGGVRGWHGGPALWTAEGCAPSSTSTTWPFCGTSPDCYWCRFEKQSHHISLSHSMSTSLPRDRAWGALAFSVSQTLEIWRSKSFESEFPTICSWYKSAPSSRIR